MTVRRITLTALTPLVLLALIPATAGAKDGTVTVSAPGADFRSVTVRLADLGAPDINNQEYALPSGRKTISGYSLAKVLTGAEAEAGGWLDLDTIPSVDVDRPSESPIAIGRSGIFDAGDRPPVFYENNGTTVFLMPGSPGAEYVFRLAPVGVKVGSGKVFEVSLSASPKKPRKGQKVTIKATVKGAPAGAALSFRWAFSDGTVKTTSVSQVIHSFSGKGRRSVVVTVTGDTGTGQGVLAIDVADGGGGDGGNSPTPSSGGDSSGGGGGGSGTGGFGGSGTGYGGGYGSGFGGFPESGSTGTPEAAVPPPETGDQSVDQPPSDLEEVSGVLIDPAASASAAAPEAGGPAETDPAGDGALGLAGEAATLLGIGLLLALGGLIEARVLVRRP